MAVTRMCVKVMMVILGVLVPLLGLLGCGGGTSGTGGTGSTQFEGRMLDTGGQPVSGLMVTVVETGDFSLTDDSGDFSILTELETSQATLQFQKDNVDTALTVSEIPAGEVRITLELRLDPEKNKVSAERVETSIAPASSAALSQSEATTSSAQNSSQAQVSVGSISSAQSGTVVESSSSVTSVDQSDASGASTSAAASSEVSSSAALASVSSSVTSTSEVSSQATSTSESSSASSSTSTRRDSQYRGQIRTSVPGLMLRGSRISILETNHYSKIERNGSFSIRTLSVGGDLSLVLSLRQGGQALAIFNDIPSGRVVVTVKLLLQALSENTAASYLKRAARLAKLTTRYELVIESISVRTLDDSSTASETADLPAQMDDAQIEAESPL